MIHRPRVEEGESQEYLFADEDEPDLEVIPRREADLNFSRVSMFALLEKVLTDSKDPDVRLQMRLIRRLTANWNEEVLEKYDRNYQVPVFERNISISDSLKALVDSEKKEIAAVEPTFTEIHESTDVRALLPERLQRDSNAWLQAMRSWWNELPELTREYFVDRFGEPLMVPGTSLGIYSREITAGQCYDVEDHFGLIQPTDAVVLNNMVYEEEREHRGGGMMTTNRMLVGEWGGIVLPWIFYEPSAMTKIRLRSVLLAQRFGVIENVPTRLYTNGPTSMHWMKVGRPVGGDWRLAAFPERSDLCVRKVDQLLI